MSAAVPAKPEPSSRPLALALALVLLAALFFRASNAPVWHLDTWAHWKYGEWIWQHGRLPEREPFSPYSEPRQPLVDTLWLSQLACYLVYASLGMEGIALLYALTEVAKAALYLVAFRRASGSWWLALLGVGLIQAGRWSFFGVFRPQNIGEVCWAALFLAVADFWAASRDALGKPILGGASAAVVRGATFVWLPLCVAVWANLHGSFLLGLAVLGVLLLGRVLEVAWMRRNPAAALADPAARRWAILCGLCGAAACLNPYGPALLVETARFSSQPILQLVKEWLPTAPWTTYESKALAISFIVVLITVRWSPRRFALSDVALLVLFGLSAWFAARMIWWWMTLAPFVLLPHWAALTATLRARLGAPGKNAVAALAHKPEAQARETPSFACASGLWAELLPLPRLPRWLAPGLGAAAAAALLLASGTGRWLLAGQPRPAEEQHTASTPVRAGAVLKAWMARDPSGRPLRVFASIHWSDYLVWDLPPSARVYWYSHWHCYSPQRMIDGNRLLDLCDPPNDWRSILQRCRFNALALKAEDSPSALFLYVLEQETRPDAEWEVIWKDEPGANGVPAGLVAVRRGDPFAAELAAAGAAQGCVGGLGMNPTAAQWSFLSDLPWIWPDR